MNFDSQGNVILVFFISNQSQSFFAFAFLETDFPWILEQRDGYLFAGFDQVSVLFFKDRYLSDNLHQSNILAKQLLLPP